MPHPSSPMTGPRVPRDKCGPMYDTYNAFMELSKCIRSSCTTTPFGVVQPVQMRDVINSILFYMYIYTLLNARAWGLPEKAWACLGTSLVRAVSQATHRHAGVLALPAAVWGPGRLRNAGDGRDVHHLTEGVSIIAASACEGLSLLLNLEDIPAR